MNDRVQEWLKQADYDMKSAEALYKARRYFYVVFMCHLSIEKALKGLLQHRSGQLPPKIHSLVRLLGRIGAEPPEDVGRFLVKLDGASVPTRYPESLETLRREYTADVARDFLTKGKESLTWIKAQL